MTVLHVVRLWMWCKHFGCDVLRCWNVGYSADCITAHISAETRRSIDERVRAKDLASKVDVSLEVIIILGSDWNATQCRNSLCLFILGFCSLTCMLLELRLAPYITLLRITGGQGESYLRISVWVEPALG